MSTTLMITEILIIGMQVLFWLLLLLIPFNQLRYENLVETLEELESYAPVLGVLVLALAYTLGTVFDRFIGFCTSCLLCILDNLFKYFRWNSFRDKISNFKFDKPTRQKFQYIIISNSEANVILDNLNRQTRLLRATCVNAFLIALIGLLKGVFSCYLGLTLIFVSVIAVFPTWFVAYMGYMNAIKELHEVIRKRENDKKSLK